MKYAVAIDIGGTNIKYALVSQEGTILYESLRAAQSKGDKPELLNKLKRITQEVLDYARSEELDVVGIGIGVPSVVDNGVVLFANNLPELNNQQLDFAMEQFKLPVFIDNDANLMGLAEIKYGVAKGISDAIFLTIGTGIGGALILNGQLYGGYRNRGTELGHIIIDCTGNSCTCGSKGCLEAHASVNALIDEYKRLISESKLYTFSEIDGKYIVAKYLENETAAVIAMKNHFYYLSIGIVSLINIFAPQKVIIGGGISESGDFYINNIREIVKTMVMKETSYFTTIELALLGNKAGFLGSAALVFNHIV